MKRHALPRLRFGQMETSVLTRVLLFAGINLVMGSYLAVPYLLIH